MNERLARALIVIAEKGNIPRAAKVLGRSPSTLTRMLKRVEGELGTTLFIRTGKGLKPTPEGEHVLETLREIVANIETLAKWIFGEHGEHTCHEWTEHEIRYLLVIRKNQNISRAAAELYLSQPSLSQMILELEETFQHPIFVREKDGVSETSFGKELLDRLTLIDAKYRKLQANLKQMDEMKRGDITIGIPTNLGTYLLPLVLPEFHKKYPGIHVHIHENNTLELERQLQEHKVDLFIMHDYENVKLVKHEVFFEDPFFLVIPGSMRGQFHFPKDRPLTQVDLQELKGVPFIMVAARQKLRRVVDRILKRAGITPEILCSTRSMETAKRLVAAGMGVTILPQTYLTLYSNTEGLEQYAIGESLNGSWKIVAAYAQHAIPSHGAQEFLRILKKSMEEKTNNE